jgi:hypothetical protein
MTLKPVTILYLPTPATEDTADVAAILAHKGKPKKRTKMQFQVRLKGYYETHDQWLPRSELKNSWFLHNYLREHQLGHLIPRSFLPVNTLNNATASPAISINTPVESRGDGKIMMTESNEQDSNIINEAESIYSCSRSGQDKDATASVAVGHQRRT